MSQSILIVEDDVSLATLTQTYLEGKQFTVDVEHHGLAAVDRIIKGSYDLIILDLMLPGKDGIAICREVRHHYQGSILMLTASNDSVDQVLGLEIGADDYVQKPVEPRILLARVRALLRRSSIQPIMAVENSASPELLVFADMTINLSARAVQLNNTELEFTSPEFDILAYLASNAGTIVSRDQMFRQLRNIDYDGQNRFVDITMSHIRRKLGDQANIYLKTVRGKGYLFVVD